LAYYQLIKISNPCSSSAFFLLAIAKRLQLELDPDAAKTGRILFCVQAIEGHELDAKASEWEEVVVYDNIHIIDSPVPNVHKKIHASLWPVCRLSSLSWPLYSLFNLSPSILILTNNKQKRWRCIFDFIWEVFWEHVIDPDDETERDETFDDHR